MVKIITGEFKGRRLATPEGEGITRPTSERIKGAMFSSIQFDIENRRVLDLFAGSGQLGLEALSRGAQSVTFVDADRGVMEIVKQNARALGVFDRCRYTVTDWHNFIRMAGERDIYDLVFIDPPYSTKCCIDAVKRLASSDVIAKGALLVLESGEEDMSEAEHLPGFTLMKHTEYGKKTALTVLLYTGEEE